MLSQTQTEGNVLSQSKQDTDSLSIRSHIRTAANLFAKAIAENEKHRDNQNTPKSLPDVNEWFDDFEKLLNDKYSQLQQQQEQQQEQQRVGELEVHTKANLDEERPDQRQSDEPEEEMNLKQFVSMVYRYINDKNLECSDYVRIIKSVFCQIFTTIHGAKHDIDFDFETVIAQNGDEDNTQSIKEETGETVSVTVMTPNALFDDDKYDEEILELVNKIFGKEMMNEVIEETQEEGDEHKTTETKIESGEYVVENTETKNDDGDDDGIMDDDEDTLDVADWMDDVEMMFMEDESFRNEQNKILNQHDYEYREEIGDTLQGEIFKARKTSMKTTNNVLISKVKPDETDNTSLFNGKYVTIKKTNKRLYRQRIAVQDAMTICVEEDAVKEAKLLKHLSIDNKQTGQHCIMRYVDYFETKEDIYLVMEHNEGQKNLKEFMKVAYKHIDSGKLKEEEFKRIIKFIFWKLFATVHWLHVYMSCCHLSLCLENVILQNCDFITSEKDGFLTINPNICTRLSGFGRAEVFNGITEAGLVSFKCSKMANVVGDIEYQSPELVDNIVYDGRKADIWALGQMLFYCLAGRPLYDTIQANGYLAALNGEIAKYVGLNGLNKYIDDEAISLINNILKPNEMERFHSLQILQHHWFHPFVDQKPIGDQIEIPKKVEVENLVSYYCYMY